MLHIKRFFSLALFLISLQAFSQTTNASKKIYSYSFEGDIALENVQSFEQSVSRLRYVESAKVKYKSPAKKGEIIIEVAEPVKSNEGENGFDVVELKKLIQSHNLSPNEFKLLQN